jgi:hypothetical protein
MVGVITAALVGSAAALAAILASDHSLAAALTSGAMVALAVLIALMRVQRIARKQAATTPRIADENDTPS